MVIYATGSTDTRYTAITGSLLTLNVDTSTHNADDVIQVIYNSELPLEVVASNTDQTVGLLKILTDLLYSNAITDAGQRQRIVIDAITAGLTLAAVTTVTTVTTVSGVTNVAGIFGVNQQMYMDMLHMQYDTGKRDRITL